MIWLTAARDSLQALGLLVTEGVLDVAGRQSAGVQLDHESLLLRDFSR
jgi:hypothetical protein